MVTIASLISGLWDTILSSTTNKDIENLKKSVRDLNYELSLLRYKDSDDEDVSSDVT